MQQKKRSAKNKTLILTEEEKSYYEKYLYYPQKKITAQEITNKTICADLFAILDFLPHNFADLLIIDPPYNLNKDFHGLHFSKTNDENYFNYLESWFPKIISVLKPTGSVYLCGDWKSTACLYLIMQKYTKIQNRITWQREKGRGAKANWKNSTEDIWFGTLNNSYYFDVESVKQKRKVLAPYKKNGVPKDWQKSDEGNFRLTHPGNFWDDISIPYWSMSENTEHPTQKPEKLIAKLILASCPKNGLVFDPFLGSGTTSVTAKKLGRNYCGIEKNNEYCLWAEKRLDSAQKNPQIQGYSDGVFWERNTAQFQRMSEFNSK